MMKAGITWAGAAALFAALAAGPAAAQDLKDEVVKTYMEYAWSLVPAKFTKPDGTSVEIDKKQKDKIMVPMDTARDVIKAGRFSAHAQICELAEDQVLNYRSLMKRESDKKKWSEQQMIYINQLHLTTVMLLTGKVKAIEKEGDKEISIDPKPVQTGQTCNDEQRQKVKDAIAAYVKSGPPVSLPTAAPAAPAATGSTQPSAAPAAAAPAAAPAPAAKK